MVSPYSLFLLKPREGIVDFGPVRMLYQIDGKNATKTSQCKHSILCCGL
jgi:hypothetical protein